MGVLLEIAQPPAGLWRPLLILDRQLEQIGVRKQGRLCDMYGGPYPPPYMLYLGQSIQKPWVREMGFERAPVF